MPRPPYHRFNLAPPAEAMPRPRPHDVRRGVIPQIESHEERARRLSKLGFATPVLVDTAPFEKPRFEGVSLGNQELPAYKHKQEIIDTIADNRITLVTGQTGSGKTTQIPQFALEAGYERVFVLLPRRVNVDNNSQRIDEEIRGELAEKVDPAELKQLVGMSHSERSTITDESMIQLMTSETFTLKLPTLAEQWKGKKVLVLADETHENNLQTEFATAHAVRQVERDDAWRMVFASATPDKDALTSAYERVNGGTIPMIEIEGRPHNIEYAEEPHRDTVQAYLEHNAGKQKTMIFVDGKRSIDETIKELRSKLSQQEQHLTRFYKLHAKISERAKQAVFSMTLHAGEKAVIVSTSAGQSGITIPGLDLVIMSGITKSPELDEEGAEGLPPRLCTQAELVQQMGRGGRDVSGAKAVLARPLGFDEYRHQDDELYAYTPIGARSPDMPAEIYHTNISRNILRAIADGEDFTEFNDYLKHRVSQVTISEVHELLNKLGAIDDDYIITDLGKTMDQFPLRPELARAAAEVVHSTKLQTQAYTLAIAAAIEAGGLIDYDTSAKKSAPFIRPTTADDYSVQLDLMLASREFFRGRSVDERSLVDMGLDPKNVYRAHRQFDKMCPLIGLDPRDIDLPHPTPDEEDELRSIFLTGMPELLYERQAVERGKAKYENVWGFDEAITREISNRSRLSMGQSAVKLVAGYPRWYTDSRGARHNIIDIGFPTSSDEVRRVLGSVAVPRLSASVRGGNLVKAGTMMFGSLSLGDVSSFEAEAEAGSDVTMLVDEMLLHPTGAVQQLQSLGMKPNRLRSLCLQHGVGAKSVHHIDSRLWPVVAEFQDMMTDKEA